MSKQLSPCICSKVRYALEIKSKPPSNNKRCSKEYWDKVVDKLGKDYGETSTKIKIAKDKYSKLVH